MTFEEREYQRLQEKLERQWEALCRRCGACCGAAEGDPCEHLVKLDNGEYSCTIYTDRFSLHQTVSGRTFHCVPIRNILHQSWIGNSHCAYKKRPTQ